jgi:hypothetical protein
VGGGIFIAAVLVRVPLVGGGQIDYDEGVYWQSLRALAAGHALFASVYSSQPPAFLLLLLPGHLVSGGALLADRATVLVLTLAGVAAAGRTAGLLAGRWAGLLAAALLAADPLFLRQSVTLQADGPAVALALVALAAAAEARGRAGRTALALAAGAGAALALAVLTKLLAAAAGPAVLVLLAVPAAGSRAPARLAAAAAGGLVLAAAVLLPFVPEWPELWRQVVGFHIGARSLPLGGLDAGTLAREVPTAVLGVAGCLVAARRAPMLAATGAAGAAGAGLFLLVQHPLWPHHAVVAAAPLALLGGGLTRVLPVRAAAAACVAALVLSVVPAAGVRAQQVPASTEAPVTAALRAGTGTGDLVITDDQFVVALAGRGVPPALVDTSFVRVKSGDLTAPAVEAIASRPDVRGVLFASGRLAELPGFRAWVAERFPDAVDVGDGRTLYLRRANS